MSTEAITLITGASSGIGVELARLFAADGSRIALVARRIDRLLVLAAELEEKHGVTVVPIEADLVERDAPARVLERLSEFTIDVVVNNAGFGLRGYAADLPVDRQLAMLDLNIRALTELTLRTLPGMIARGRGGILNVGSVAGFLPGPGMALYFATKAYVLNFSEAISEEARPHGVTVTALCPGPTPTEFQEVAGGPGHAGTIIRPLSALEVARAGYDGFRGGKTVVVPGFVNKTITELPRLFPRGLVRRLVGRGQKPRTGGH
jgi:short-subunit dehydrogenase